jgi:anaerobic selenocysteine-containing dehydrogenase
MSERSNVLSSREAAVEHVITSCTCDCPDTCSILATVEGGRVVRIRGNPDSPVTRGFLCRKARGFLKRLFSTERILYPLLRDGARWKRISWDEAGELVAGRIDTALRRYGPLSLYYYRDAGSIAALKIVNEAFFNLLGGASFAGGSLCGGAGIAGQTLDFGVRTSHDPSDLLRSRLIIIWGRNPAWTNVHLVPLLREAKRKGTELVLIDPIRTATSRLVDKHIAPVPGSDAILAAGVAGVLMREGLIDHTFIANHTSGYDDFARIVERFDLKQVSQMTGVTINDIRELALKYGRQKPAAIVGGWGVQRRRGGATTYRFLDALAAISGNIGIPGGGVSHGMDERRWFDVSVNLRDRAGQRREIPKAQTGRGLLDADDPPVRVAFVSAANPVNQCPNTNLVRRAFQSIDFVVVIDMFMTDTAQVADLVLPSTHFLQERDVVASYWHNYVMPVNVVQARLAEEKTDLEVFALIARHLTMEQDLVADPDFYLEKIIAPLGREGVSLQRIMEGPVRPRSASDVPFEDRVFPTRSGRFEFPGELAMPSRTEAETYPYHLLSPHPSGRNHSQLAGTFERILPAVKISPVTASRHAIGEGDEIQVTTRYGSLVCTAAVSDAVRHDTVVIYEGSWDCLGGTVNRLTPDTLSAKGLCATYYDSRCSIRRHVEG